MSHEALEDDDVLCREPSGFRVRGVLNKICPKVPRDSSGAKSSAVDPDKLLIAGSAPLTSNSWNHYRP
jgi:hypothetical protein